jgi:alanine racemase
VDIALHHLSQNYRLIKKFAGDKPIMGVIKSDAYGHGLVECARVLIEEGVAHLGVQDVYEGVALRDAGIKAQQVYVMSGLDYPSQITLAAERDLVIFVYSREQLVNIINLAQVRSFNIKVMLKIDSGMGRLGMPEREVMPFLQQAYAAPSVQVMGLATHLATISDAKAVEQLNLFQHLIKRSEDVIQAPLVSSALSGGSLLAHPEYPDGLPRVGLALYGVGPPPESLKNPVPYKGKDTGGEDSLFPHVEPKKPTHHASGLSILEKLKPVMRVSSTIIQLKRLRKGDSVSYDRIFVAPNDMFVAIIPFGYANGLHSSRSEKNCALIKGHRVEQIGKVCMNLTAFDVSALTGVKPGDEVVLLGESGEEKLDAYHEYFPEKCNPYELLCHYGRLNRKFFHKS